MAKKNKKDKYTIYVLCRPGMFINRFWVEGEGSKSRIVINVNRAHKFSDIAIAKQIITLNKLVGFKVLAFNMRDYTLKAV